MEVILQVQTWCIEMTKRPRNTMQLRALRGRAPHARIPGMHVSTRSSCSSTSTVRGILPASEASSSISCSLIFWKSTVAAVCRRSSKL